ncbi:hypothetical protein [Acidovorax sp. sic0104]|uniref:hypothetical protein n=1 Tax=Acidovorax sp. sic0104 TaxID=2854784 RepID=UPI001C466878|nr:hypothetical protein [Acidovorax sp. sic0104]MBV7542139.1 hypothetical protein [Acidovorax sp. sic0104]
MFGLLMVMFSIVLFSAVSVMAINYLPVDALLTMNARTNAVDGFTSLSGGAARYIRSVTDADGVAHLPAPGVDLTSALQPGYVFIPRAPKGMDWSIQSGVFQGLPAIGICLYPVGTIDEPTVRGVNSAMRKLPQAAAFASGGCNAQVNSGGAFVTYWVVANHHAQI